MSKIDNFLFDLRKEKNIFVGVDNGQLAISGAKNLLIPALVDEIKSRKEEILEYFESQKEHRAITVPRTTEKEKYALSSAQKRVYFEKEMDKQSLAYNLPVFIKLKGNLDIERFEKAFQEIVRRHEILRTSFESVKGELFQKPHSAIDFKISLIKATAEIPSIVKDFIQPFDLHQAPLFRIGLVETAPEEYVLLFDIHHIITDGISNSLLIDEFVQIYSGKDLALPELEYRDYAEWQQGEEYNTIVDYQKEFWKGEFAEMPVPLDLPIDHLRATHKRPSAGCVTFELEKPIVKDLQGIANDLATTPYSILLSVYYVLLNKLSGQEDIVIGTVTTGRFNKQVESLPGMFVNTVPLRNFPKGDLSFRDFVQNVKSSTALCFDHQLYQFDNLVKDLEIDRGNNRNPLFDVFFAYHNYHLSQLEIPGLSVEPLKEGLIKTLFDIELTAYEDTDRITLSFLYNAHLFNKEKMERYVDYFDKILCQVISAPGMLISGIDIIGADERARLLHVFNNTVAEYPKHKTIIDLYEEQVKKTPDNVAVRGEGFVITYKQLKERSDQMAHYLQQEEGVGVGDLVGLLLDREEELLPSIYGIMKSGAAYVPLSPHYPSARLNTIMSDARLKVVITRKQYIDALLIETASRLLDLNSSLEKIKGLPAREPNGGPGANDMAYVIYTSGSTGKPKGVMIEHHSIVNRLLWMQKKYILTEKDVLLQKTPLVFDVSIWELFWWAFTGAGLCLLPPGGEKDPKIIIHEIEKNGVTTIHFVPSMLSVFLDVLQTGAEGDLNPLRQVFASGEALGADQVSRFSRILYDRYGTQLINLYGPTEATVDVSYYECDLTRKSETIPIGKPIDNIQLYILDKKLRLSPLGVPGELCIGGAGVARGYLHNADLTSDKFVTVFLDKEERVYRSGDLARWLPDGNIQYLGRMDDQVKIRGYRIEPGEIENQLLQHPLISEAAVTVKDGQYLVAHYVSEEKIDKNELKTYLLRTLPDYMVPPYYSHLTRMPLSSNGKLDRKKLAGAQVEIRSTYVEPESELQRSMANIWGEVLKIHRVGITDDYFSLGGDSIKAIKLIYEINARLNCNLQLADIYTNKTVESLCSLVVPGNEKNDSLYLEARLSIERFQREYREQQGFLPEEYENVYPMTGVEKGMVYYTQLKDKNEQHFDNILYHEQNYYAIPFSEFQPETFKKALSLLVDKHDTLRKVYDTGNFAHIILKKIDPEVNYIDISGFSKEKQEEYWKEKINTERLRASGFDKQLLWRMNILKLADDFHYMIFDMHHSVFDGWSLHAFLTELNNTYLKLREDAGYVPEKLNASYADHILTELVDMNNSSSIDFWKQEMKSYNRYTFFRRDKEHRFITKYIPMDAGLKAALRVTASELNTSLKELFFAAFAYTMGMFSDKGNFVIGRTTNNRPYVKDGEKLLGCFLNQYPCSVNIPSEGAWVDFIHSISQKSEDLKLHERMPFYKILEISDQPAGKGINPFFDLAFNYIDFWIVGEIIKADDATQKRYHFWHDDNDVNQNTLFDFHVKTTLDTFFVCMEYSTTILDEPLVNRIFEYFHRILHLFVHCPNEPIDRDAVLPEKEKESLLNLNKPPVGIPIQETVVTLFERQVGKSPDTIALVYEDQSFTYKELNSRSNQLAKTLVLNGYVPNTIVGLLMERGPLFVIGMLAILKAGGAYLPIDTELPRETIQFQLTDSDVKMLVTESSQTGVVDKTSFHCIFADQLPIGEEDTHNPDTPMSPGDLCCILYTSGATGKPNGVMIEHKNLVGLLFSQGNPFDFGPEDIWTMIHSPTFDVGIWEMYEALLYGGKLVIVPGKTAQDPKGCCYILQQHGVTVLHQTPTAFYNLTHEENAVLPDNLALRYVIFVGEAPTPGKLSGFRRRFPSVRLINMYGITEATAHASYKEITDYEIDLNINSIGTPIPGSSVYLFDRHQRLVPQGAQGEIYVGGEGVAKGYLNREQLTREKFVINPYKPGERLYRSGDAGRLLDNGEIEYLGRLDRQVKIQGYRIEPGEIEYQLMSFPSVKQAAVLCLDDADDKKLVAFLLPEENVGLNFFEIKKFLKLKLPGYMLPAFIRKVDNIPLTPNGTIDEKALLRLVDKSPSEKVVASKPRSDIELYLAKVWRDILLVDEIGMHDNFFDLGGHSLLVVKANTMVIRQYSVELPLNLYLHSTLEQIAQQIEMKKK
jgi:tyrocidine synthetase-3